MTARLVEGRKNVERGEDYCLRYSSTELARRRMATPLP